LGGGKPPPQTLPPDQRHNRYGPVITVRGVGGDFSETLLILTLTITLNPNPTDLINPNTNLTDPPNPN